MSKKFSIIALIFLISCSETHKKIALNTTDLGIAHNFIQKTYNTKTFKIFTLKKFHDKNKALRIYIEGDGKAYINKHTPSLNPTPTSYFLISLAIKDDYPNILYIARPCQYVDDIKCQNAAAQKYWTNARFSTEAVEAISEIIKKFPQQKIELIGYSGGGAIAKLIAQKNKNIINFRTIAGNLDHQKFSEIHNVSPLDQSASDRNLKALAQIPQIHFVGEKDKVIPEIIAQTYLKKLPQKNCTKIITVKNLTHSKGWQNEWNNLLRIEPQCE